MCSLIYLSDTFSMKWSHNGIHKALNILQTTFLSMSCMNCLRICLYTQFKILQTSSCLRVVHALGYWASTKCLFACVRYGPFCKKAPGDRRNGRARRLVRRRGRLVLRGMKGRRCPRCTGSSESSAAAWRIILGARVRRSLAASKTSAHRRRWRPRSQQPRAWHRRGMFYK
jgi:hypothetical protein